MIAGHLFALDGRCSCGKRFQDIAGAGRDQIGVVGWAHQSYLTEAEYNQIVAERDRIWTLVANSSMDGAPAMDLTGLDA